VAFRLSLEIIIGQGGDHDRQRPAASGLEQPRQLELFHSPQGDVGDDAVLTCHLQHLRPPIQTMESVCHPGDRTARRANSAFISKSNK
jgi:hypothetical protein